ncbi:MAG: hypothetical protein V4712_01265 [Pseudomonadota bacterium]
MPHRFPDLTDPAPPPAQMWLPNLPWAEIAILALIAGLLATA